jgi:hypothetical protein
MYLGRDSILETERMQAEIVRVEQSGADPLTIIAWANLPKSTQPHSQARGWRKWKRWRNLPGVV